MAVMNVVAASLLAADFGRLRDEAQAVERAGADWLHLDIMDGHFVPNLSFGPSILLALRRHLKIPCQVHLMIAPTDAFIKTFVDAGADHVLVHAEAGPNLHRTLQLICSLGVKAGVVLNPATPLEHAESVLDMVDIVLLMTVNPGFGGQNFLENQLPRITRMCSAIEASGRPIRLEVDGGITAETAARAVTAGADALVAGTALFGSPDYTAAIRALRSPVP